MGFKPLANCCPVSGFSGIDQQYAHGVRAFREVVEYLGQVKVYRLQRDITVWEESKVIRSAEFIGDLRNGIIILLSFAEYLWALG